MKKRNIIIKNIAFAILILVGFIACDKDFAGLDSDVINPDNATNFLTDFEEYSIITSNNNITPVRTNGLSSYLLGYNYDPVYGTSVSNFVSQINPIQFDPTFGENVVLDSVILTIPYFSRIIETDDEGNNTYELDSIFGNTAINLSVFKNNYFLRMFDPNSEFNESQKYFSNSSTSSSNFISPSELEGDLLYREDAFLPNKNEILLTEIDTATNEPFLSSRIAPAIRVKLYDENPDVMYETDEAYWKDLIFDKEGEPELSNQNNFEDYFRGIYFKAAATEMNGTLMMLNFAAAEANITLYYTSDTTVTDTETDTETTTTNNGTYILNLTRNQVNFFDNNFMTIADGDMVNGDAKLYLKGGEGAMAIINLFNGDEDGNSLEFEEFKDNYTEEDGTVKRLINEAYLEFYVDQTTVVGEEPDRLYIFDLNNNITLADYVFDQSVNATTTKLDHLVPLQRVGDEPDGQGIKYRFRITQHINNLAFNDSTNVKLGLVVTTNVASINNYELQDDTGILESLVEGAILSPRSTVLHGNNTSNLDKRVVFKIFYTEPEN